jgi:hypothetical protein
MRRVALLLLAAAAGAASAQQAPPTPIPQSVVVPSLPDQRNKETNVRPSGTLAVDSAGWVKTGPADATPASPSAAAPHVPPDRGAPGGVAFGAPPSAPGPTGPAVVAAAERTLRGTVKSWQKGASITITESSGRERTVPLAENAAVYEGLKAGDRVVLTLPLGKPADGRSASKVEKEKPKAPPPKSKFAAAQTPGS